MGTIPGDARVAPGNGTCGRGMGCSNPHGGSYHGWPMLNDVYNKKILGFAADIPRHQRLADPDASAVAHSRLCGSKVTVDVKMDGPRVADFGHEVKACALGQASSSIMARNAVGSTSDELHRI